MVLPWWWKQNHFVSSAMVLPVTTVLAVKNFFSISEWIRRFQTFVLYLFFTATETEQFTSVTMVVMMTWTFFQVELYLTKVIQNFMAITLYLFSIFKNFRWRRALSSKLFQRVHATKWDSELNNEELLSKTFPLKFFRKLC